MNLALPVLLIAGMSAIFSLSAKKSAWDTEADERKADYLFMEAQRANAVNDHDAYYALIKRAFELNKRESAVGHELGFYTLMLANGDSTMTAEGYELMNSHFCAHPDDYYNSVFFGTICEKLGKRDRALEVWYTLDSIYPSKIDVSMRLADALSSYTADTARQRQALRLLDRVESAEGISLQLTSRKVRALMALRDTASMFDELHHLLSSTPQSADSRVYAGDLFMALGNRDSAIAYYDNACRVDPTSGLAYFKRAGYYQAMGDSAGYDREVFRALQLPDLELDTKLSILTGYVRELYTDSLQQPRIRQLFGTLLDMYPHEAQVHDLYSAYLVAVDDPAGAAEQQGYVLDADPSDPDRWRSQIGLYVNAKRFSDAVSVAKRATELFPHNSLLYLLGGEAASLADDYGLAKSMLQSAVAEADTTDYEYMSHVYCTLGDVEYKQGNSEVAFKHYDRALELNPGNTYAMNNCAYFMACEGIDLDRAERLSAKSLEKDPDNTSSLDTYAWILFKKADYLRAKMYIDRVLELESDPSAELFHHAGDIYFMAGSPDKALEFWKRAAELDPNDKLLRRKIDNKTYFYE